MAKIHRTTNAQIELHKVLDIGGFNLDHAMEIDRTSWRKKPSTITTITTTKLPASAWNVMVTATDRSSTNGSPNYFAPRARTFFG
jgi:hypothetical protein